MKKKVPRKKTCNLYEWADCWFIAYAKINRKNHLIKNCFVCEMEYYCNKNHLNQNSLQNGILFTKFGLMFTHKNCLPDMFCPREIFLFFFRFCFCVISWCFHFNVEYKYAWNSKCKTNTSTFSLNSVNWVDLIVHSFLSFFSSLSFTFCFSDDSYPVTIKDEPDTVPNSPPMSPIDMENQEKIKLERKRQRNRVAASKCRKRKLERISKLEDKVKALKGENTELGGVIKALKEHVSHLKQQVMDHVHNGCSIPACNVPYFVKTSNANDSDIK